MDCKTNSCLVTEEARPQTSVISLHTLRFLFWGLKHSCWFYLEMWGFPGSGESPWVPFPLGMNKDTLVLDRCTKVSTRCITTMGSCEWLRYVWQVLTGTWSHADRSESDSCSWDHAGGSQRSSWFHRCSVEESRGSGSTLGHLWLVLCCLYSYFFSSTLLVVICFDQILIVTYFSTCFNCGSFIIIIIINFNFYELILDNE